MQIIRGDDYQSWVYSNKDDYIDEISKQKNSNPSDSEVIIKLD